jgi:hypothetical protein
MSVQGNGALYGWFPRTAVEPLVEERRSIVDSSSLLESKNETVETLEHKVSQRPSAASLKEQNIMPQLDHIDPALVQQQQQDDKSKKKKTFFKWKGKPKKDKRDRVQSNCFSFRFFVSFFFVFAFSRFFFRGSFAAAGRATRMSLGVRCGQGSAGSTA